MMRNAQGMNEEYGQNFWDNFSDLRRKAAKSECPHRVGPAPREDLQIGSDRTADIGTLDSDNESEQKTIKKRDDKRRKQAGLAGCKSLIIYFSKLAKKTNTETIDYRFLDSLFRGGASVNTCDKYGQTALFEVARNWNIDVARFLMHYGADINHKDKWGRTPLHLASAVNHYDMVEFLIQNGGDINAKTNNEEQSPIHYAAKYNAVSSLKVILENKGHLNARDYKHRTPVFLAAEMGQQDSARFLVEFGAPVGIFDDTGMSAIGCMVEKMPHVALDSLNQFVVKDDAFRKMYYYLNYLEYDPVKWRLENTNTDEWGVALQPTKSEQKKKKREQRLACPTTALQLAVEHQDIEIIMHPVVQMLIRHKWNQFGRFWAIVVASIHLFYIMLWTWLAIFLPKDGKYYEHGIEWKVVLEVIAVILTFWFLAKIIWEKNITYNLRKNFRIWRSRQLRRDLEFCHPRWAQEKTFLESELKASRRSGTSVLKDPYNILEFVTYVAVVVVFSTRVLIIFDPSENSDEVHRKTYAALLILMWLHFMKSCRPFTALGPFISMLGHVIIDTGRFTFLFFEFFLPYAAGFWILFGGHVNATKAGDDDPIDWHLFHDSLFSTLQVMLNVEYNWEALATMDLLMAQILVGTYYALSTVMCMNLYVALLTETFNKVYQNAKANASLLQATTILQIEKALSQKAHKKAMDTMQDECGPLVTDQIFLDEGICPSNNEMWDGVVRRVLTKLMKFQDATKKTFPSKEAKKSMQARSSVVQREELARKRREEKEAYILYQGFLRRDKELYRLMLDLHEMKCMALKLLGEGDNLPPVPKYKPFPDVKIPIPPCYQQPNRRSCVSERSISFDDIIDDNDDISDIHREEGKQGGPMSVTFMLQQDK